LNKDLGGQLKESGTNWHGQVCVSHKHRR